MAKVIEFYVPTNFRKSSICVAEPHPGNLIKFCPQANNSITPESGGVVLSWRLKATESNPAVGSE